MACIPSRNQRPQLTSLTQVSGVLQSILSSTSKGSSYETHGSLMCVPLDLMTRLCSSSLTLRKSYSPHTRTSGLPIPRLSNLQPRVLHTINDSYHLGKSQFVALFLQHLQNSEP
jgi:hypothetical protein